MRSIWTLIVTATFVCFNVSASAEIANRVVAIVDNDIITLYELNNKVRELTGYSQGGQQLVNDNEFIEIRRNILNQMINERLVQAKLNELGISITSDHIDDYIEKLKQDNGLTQETLLASLKNDGVSYEKFRENLKQDMERSTLIMKEIKSKIIITDDQVTKYYNDNKEKYIEAKFHIAGIILKPDNQNNEEEMAELVNKAQEILARLRKGEDFATLAKEYSQGLGADKGGYMGEYKSSSLNPEFLKILFGLSEGGISEDIVSPSGIQIIKLISREIAGVKTIEDVRVSIEEALYKKEVDEKFISWLENLRKSAYIEIVF